MQGQEVFHVEGTEGIPNRGSELRSKLKNSKAMETLTFGNNRAFFPKCRPQFSLQPQTRTVVQKQTIFKKNKQKSFSGFYSTVEPQDPLVQRHILMSHDWK